MLAAVFGAIALILSTLPSAQFEMDGVDAISPGVSGGNGTLTHGSCHCPTRKDGPYVYSEFIPGEPRPQEGAHDTSALGLGLAIGDAAWFFPFPALAGADTPLQMSIGGESVFIHFSADGLTSWAENDAGVLLMSVLAYEQGWRNFYPHTRVWR